MFPRSPGRNPIRRRRSERGPAAESTSYPKNRARAEPKGQPWYRPLLVTAGLFAAMVLVGTGAIMAIRNDAAAMTGTTTTTPVQPALIAPAAAPPPSEQVDLPR